MLQQQYTHLHQVIQCLDALRLELNEACLLNSQMCEVLYLMLAVILVDVQLNLR